VIAAFVMMGELDANERRRWLARPRFLRPARASAE
jgi:hypothetical protein